MKKLLAFSLAVVMLLAFAACSGVSNTQSQSTEEQGTTSQVASTESQTPSSSSEQNIPQSSSATTSSSSVTSSSATTSQPDTTSKPATSVSMNISQTSNPATTSKPAVTTQPAISKSTAAATTKPATTIASVTTTKSAVTTKPATTVAASTTAKPVVTTAAPTTTVHSHQFSDATCTEPEKCACGITNGTGLGHNYDQDGICSRCHEKDPDFTYPSLTSMSGGWTSIHKEENVVVKLTHIFSSEGSEDVLPYGAMGSWYFLAEDVELGDGESLDDYESMVFEGKTYYLVGRGFAMEGYFVESGDMIVVNDLYSQDVNNRQMILTRTSTNTLEVSFFGSGIEYVNIPIGAVLTFNQN